ncbi:MAG: CotH kinase family protein [Candidatus Eisenbacteria sp.]|nr:CotH kinase family protein [Candidatus Eisenbacteria bacterium]
MEPPRVTLLTVVTSLLSVAILLTPAHAQGWPEIFDPLQVLTLNLEMNPLDWATIQNDETFDIEVPANFWADGEEPILVSVRRKSADPLTEAEGFLKVSLKIDINEYVSGQTWHDLKKVSLENGDDQDVVSEGLAWHLHRLASGVEGYGYPAGHGCWVTLYINGIYTGVYVSVEQRDEQFLRNRDLYVSGETWLYKLGDIGEAELKVGEGDSPTYEALCYSPFRSDGSACETPGPATLAAELPLLVNMQGMLTLAAVNAFATNPDALFTHGKNVFFADFLGGRTRMYFPWDLDSVIRDSGSSIYPSGSAYAEVLLGVPEFHDLFTQIMNNLLCGPLAAGDLVTFLDDVEGLLAEALENDPNNQIGEDETVAEHFDELRSWVTARVEHAFSELNIPTSVRIPESMSGMSLYQPRPNPSCTTTRIDWAMRDEGHVRLRIFDTMGRLVTTLVDEEKRPGEYSVAWRGLDRNGHVVPAGVYFARLHAGPWFSVREIIRPER